MPQVPEGRRRRFRAVPTVALLAVLGCSVGPAVEGHRDFARGDFAAARQAYESALEQGREDPEVMLRLAVIYLSSESEAPRGVELLRRLVTDDVGGPYRPVASLLLASRRDVAEAREELEALRLQIESLGRELAEGREATRRLEAQKVTAGEAMAKLEASRSRVQAELERARERLVVESERVKALEAELEKLKAIDLGRPPGS